LDLAALAAKPQDWAWSSAREHLQGRRLSGASWPSDYLLKQWPNVLAAKDKQTDLVALRHQTFTGRPLGGRMFVSRLESIAGRLLRALPRGRPAKKKDP